MFVFWGIIWCRDPWAKPRALVAAVLVVEVLRQLLDHLELPGLVLVVAVTNSRLDDIFVHRARRREAEVALEVVLGHLEVGVVLGRVHVEDVLRVPGRRATRLEDEALAGGGRRRSGRRVVVRGAESFNQPLNNWNVSSVKFMSGMFEDATEIRYLGVPMVIWRFGDKLRWKKSESE